MSLWRTIWNIGIDYIAVPLGLVTPVQPTSRADNLLSEEVRARWESEQNELKKEIVYSDSQQILDMLQCYNNKDTPGETYYVAGVDISFVKDDDVNACAALVVLTYPELKVVYEDYKMIQLTEPYIPGFLGFREAPFIVDLFDVLYQRAPQYYPHVVMVDGNGILHPKQFGSACHVGVLLDLPCIGVAKKLFHVGGLQKDENHQNKIKTLLKGGDTFPLVIDTGETLGMALRSCDGSTNPVYVSPGNHVTMETAVRLVHRCSKVRVPEPVRMADIRSREYIRDNFKPDDQATGPDQT